MSNSRIPDSITEFNDYINNTDTYQLQSDMIGPPPGTTHWQRLGLTLAESTEWTNRRVLWRDTLYPQYSNANTSTKVVKANVQLFMKGFRTFANPLLNRMAVSPNVRPADEQVFRFVANRDTTPTGRGKINDLPHPLLQAIGGGEVKIKVRTLSDATRASRHPLADAVEVRWVVLAPAAAGSGTPTPGTPSSAAVVIPEVPDNCPNVFTSRKAFFTLATGPASKNKNLYCFFRWINTVTPANSGPWSNLFQTPLL